MRPLARHVAEGVWVECKQNTPAPRHVPVLLQEVLDALAPRPDGIIVDATVGLGGHSAALLSRIPHGQLIGLDQDPDSLVLAQAALEQWRSQVTLCHANFGAIADVLRDTHVTRVDGILADLGLSSWQLAQADRGLSFQLDGALDMRMDPTQTDTAANLLRRLSLTELTDLFRQYGEERYAARIARAIVQTRRQTPLRTTHDLVHLIRDAVPSAAHQRIHPATRVFQALRIAVNQELQVLQTLLDAVPSLLADGGRLAVISFHSLEDRLVKRAMRTWKQSGHAEVLTSRPIEASAEEVAANPRARSAKLRVCRWVGTCV
jgi:16S rRNA (cytosine1402-N4)-methyltransferase